MTKEEFEAIAKETLGTIKMLREREEAIWESQRSHILELIKRGDYERERQLQKRIIQSVDLIQREIIELERSIPPYVILRDDGNLEMVAYSDRAM